MTRRRRSRWREGVALAAFVVSTLLTAPAALAADEVVSPEPAPTSGAPVTVPGGELPETEPGATLNIATPTVGTGMLAMFEISGSEPGRGVTAIIATQPQPDCDCAFVPHIWEGDATVDSGGNASFSAPIPADTPAGTYYVSVVNAAPRTLSAPVRIVTGTQHATMSVSPDTQAPGASVAVTIREFPGARARLGMTAPGGDPWWELPAVDIANGSFDGSVTVPADVPPGTWQLWAMIPDSLAVVAVADITVVGPTTPSISTDVPQARPGGAVTVSGAGFEPGEKVRVELHSTPIVLGAVTADAAGAAQTTVTIPTGVEGDTHELVLIGETSGRSAQTALTIVRSVVGGAYPATAGVPGKTDPAGGRQLAATGVSDGSISGIAATALALVAGGVLLRRRPVRAGSPLR